MKTPCRNGNEQLSNLLAFTKDIYLPRGGRRQIYRAQASIIEKLRRGERLVHFETARQRKDGILIPVSLTISPIRDEHGRIMGFSKINRDLSESQRMH